MRKIACIIIALAACTLQSCDDIPEATKNADGIGNFKTGDVVKVTSTSATFTNPNSVWGKYEVSADPSFANPYTTSYNYSSSAIEVTGLTPSTTYHYRFVYGESDFSSSAKKVYAETRTFTTLSAMPEITDAAVVARTAVRFSVQQNMKLYPSFSQKYTLGICYSQTQSEPTTRDKTYVYVNNSSASYYFEEGKTDVFYVTDLQNGATYHVRPFYTDMSTTETVYGEPVTVTVAPTGTDYAQAVDMGTSVLWADRNVFAASPEDKGQSFGYGSITPGTKGNYATGDISGQTVDPAYAHWGEAWRMPTYTELRELFNNCSKTWSLRNGVFGLLLVPNDESLRNNDIFLPYTITVGSASTKYGYYISGTVNSNGYPIGVSFSESKTDGNFGYFDGNQEFFIRPVKAK